MNPFHVLRAPYARALKGVLGVLVLAAVVTTVTHLYRAEQAKARACLTGYRLAFKPDLRDRLAAPADPCAALEAIRR